MEGTAGWGGSGLKLNWEMIGAASVVNPTGWPDRSVEIAWIACERCGALGPKVERSRGQGALQTLCCGLRDDRHGSVSRRGGAMKTMVPADSTEDSGKGVLRGCAI